MRDFERAARGGREQGTTWWRWLPAAVARGDEAERSCSGPRGATRSIRDRGEKWLALVGGLDREGIPRKKGLEEWRRRDGIDGTRLLGSRVRQYI